MANHGIRDGHPPARQGIWQIEGNPHHAIGLSCSYDRIVLVTVESFFASGDLRRKTKQRPFFQIDLGLQRGLVRRRRLIKRVGVRIEIIVECVQRERVVANNLRKRIRNWIARDIASRAGFQSIAACTTLPPMKQRLRIWVITVASTPSSMK